MDFNRDRVVAIARLVVMLAAMVAGGFGLQVDADSLGTIAACAVALVAAAWSWWRNNNVTEAARAAQEYLDGIKGGYDGQEP